ncbi:uncharacterized protein LOC122507797 [Leptopilina heterotoma]|uniref:uncharacterized protein LOC122507797 n=1 Tax=Leptopilina heterotoma TaxID=63436 RepID=UPI001CA94F6A|nr:uncharacterized protein LOC122507797 [Leptopilina heterotoma]
MNEVTCAIEDSGRPETLMDQLINDDNNNSNNKINESSEMDTEFIDTISMTKADTDDLFSMDTLHDSTIDRLDEPTLGGFYDLSDIDKFSNFKSKAVQMPEVSSTENVKIIVNTSQPIDADLDEIPPNRPKIISEEIVETKILLYQKSTIYEKDNEKTSTAKKFEADKNTSSNSLDICEIESLSGMDDCRGFSIEDVTESFEKIKKNISQQPVEYDFPNIYRETSIISIPNAESISYLNFNLPDQVEPLESIVLGKNLIKPSMFYFKGSGYTELDSLMRKCSIIGQKIAGKSKRANKKDKTLSIIQKGKLNVLMKKRKIEQFVANEQESSVERRQTRFLLKNQNQLLQQLSDTPKSNQNNHQSKPRKIISQINKLNLKDVRVSLERIEIIKEYAHLDYLNSSPLIDPSDSSENEQSLRMDESSKKEISFATRRSDRLRKSEIKGIIPFKSKYRSIKQKKRVSFSESVFIKEF